MFLLVVAATLLGFTVAQDQSTDGTITGTGVTALVLLLFLLRTLASIYRHNMRLAAFYDSKADYLQAGGKTKGLSDADLLSLFSTAEVDIDWTEKLNGMLRFWTNPGYHRITLARSIPASVIWPVTRVPIFVGVLKSIPRSRMSAAVSI